MAYIVRRQSVYYLNLRLPKHLFPNRHTLRISLRVRERQAALFLATSLVQKANSHLSEHPLTPPETLRLLCSQWCNSSPMPTARAAPLQAMAPCSGLLTPDTHLGENARHREVSDDQATPYLYP
ncbi:DUF6538 domain-containing protein [Pseudomonas putida]|uniref:DUF6538 domain-containing protein n=1 Tax=Pseudomonas putida TaxID=303 RepID=UPI003CC7DF68